MHSLRELLDCQEGVITRQQAIAAGLTRAELRSKLRRREWVSVYVGVYVNHTGLLTWKQRAWSALLSVPGSALGYQSAIAAALGAAAAGPIHLVVGRKAAAPRRSGVVVRRYARLDEHVQRAASPPRIRIEHAVLDVAGSAATVVDAIAHLSDAVQARVTTAPRLRKALDSRPRSARRKLLGGVLAAIHEGTCSVLEHGYLTKVERPHELPKPRRQEPTRVGRRGFRDVEYDEWGLLIELDGRPHHDSARARDADMERDRLAHSRSARTA